jgi:hypothetical protein
MKEYDYNNHATYNVPDNELTYVSPDVILFCSLNHDHQIRIVIMYLSMKNRFVYFISSSMEYNERMNIYSICHATKYVYLVLKFKACKE